MRNLAHFTRCSLDISCSSLLMSGALAASAFFSSMISLRSSRGSSCLARSMLSAIIPLIRPRSTLASFLGSIRARRFRTLGVAEESKVLRSRNLVFFRIPSKFGLQTQPVPVGNLWRDFSPASFSS